MEALGKKVMKGKPDKPLRASGPAQELVASMLVVRASQRAGIDQVCEDAWVKPKADEPPLNLCGHPAEVEVDEGVGSRLDAMGCPLTLVQHHVQNGTTNHITAAYEILLHGE